MASPGSLGALWVERARGGCSIEMLRGGQSRARGRSLSGSTPQPRSCSAGAAAPTAAAGPVSGCCSRTFSVPRACARAAPRAHRGNVFSAVREAGRLRSPCRLFTPGASLRVLWTAALFALSPHVVCPPRESVSQSLLVTRAPAMVD